jgi:MFS family permease
MTGRDSSDQSSTRVRVPGLRALRLYAEGVSRFDRAVKLLFYVTAARGMVIASIGTILNLYLYSLGYDARFIGLFNAANAVATLVVSLPLGYAADRVGRPMVMLIGGVGYPIAILAVALAPNGSMLLAFNFVFGAVASCYWVAAIPMLYTHTDERQRVQAFSINSFLLWGFGPLGALLSSQVVEVAARLLGVTASSSTALRGGVFFMAGIAALGAVPYPFLRDRRASQLAVHEIPSIGRMSGLVVRLLVPDGVLAFGVGAVLIFVQLYFHVRFHLDPGPIGIVMALGGVAAGACTLITPAVSRHWGNLGATLRLQWTVVPFMAVLAFSHVLGVSVLSFWLLVALRGMVDPVYTAFIQERVPEAFRSRIAGLYEVTYAIGSSLGPGISGQLQQTGGFTLAFLFGTGSYLLGAGLLYAFFGRGYSPPPPTSVASVPP